MDRGQRYGAALGFNPKNHPIEMVLTLKSSQLTTATIKTELQPRESRDLLAGHTLSSSGSLRLRSSDSTIPILAGLAYTESALLQLPVVPSTDSSKERLALRWPLASRSYLSLFSQQRAAVEVLARDRKGDPVGIARLEVPARGPGVLGPGRSMLRTDINLWNLLFLCLVQVEILAMRRKKSKLVQS